MDDIEDLFMAKVAGEMLHTSKMVTDGQNSDKTGFNPKATNELVSKLKAKTHQAGGGRPLHQPIAQSQGLEPLQITPEMLKEIQDFEGGGSILPEIHNTQQYIPVQGQIPQTHQISSDPNQMEFDFTMISAQDVYKSLKVQKEMLDNMVKFQNSLFGVCKQNQEKIDKLQQTIDDLTLAE